MQDRRQYFPLLFTNFDFKVQTQTDHNKQNKHNNKQTGEKKKKTYQETSGKLNDFSFQRANFIYNLQK